MTEQARDSGEELDLATIARDDELLDALGRGDPAPDGDDIAAMLAAWRTEVDDDGEQRLIRAATDVGPPEPVTGPTPVGRGALRLAAAVVALLAIATGLGVGSRHASPSSPLWSLTRVLYPEHAQVRDVEATLTRARAALADGRLDEARDLATRARRDLAGVDDAAVAARLRADLDALDRDLAVAVPLPVVPTPPAPTGGAAPTTPAPAGSTTAPAPGATGGAPAPSPPRPVPSTSAPGLPPILPLPSLPGLGGSGSPILPLPSLPGLPLPTLG
ncbi:anti-sigma-D factor RsdA [Micromonospora costi]|uniref:anti-sigma-D factor RsdA n=1 Tax=Micromonospora costi TaxID=1530042 RepID=UPI0033D5D327